MKTKLTSLLILLVIGSLSVNAQIPKDQCATTLSLFSEPAKIKNYDAARQYFNPLRTDCPNVSIALYQLGERMLKADLKKAAAGDKLAIANDLIELLKQREQYFASKTKSGQNAAKIAQIKTDNKIGTAKSQFDAFDAAWKKDKGSITDPKNIYTYFKLAVDSYKANEFLLEDVFDLYDEVQEKMKGESNKLASSLTPLINKQENNEVLSSKEKKNLKRYETNLRAFSIFSTNTDVYLGELADCPNLIPLYNKDFEEKKNDVEWIKKAAGRMSGKDCTDDPLFIRLVEQLDILEPSPQTKQYLAILEKKKGNIDQAIAYWQEAVEVIGDPNKKSDLYYRIAQEFKKKGNYGQARTNYNKALEYDPSKGQCYLQIAAMYSNSANNCGSDNFNKRAVYWLAASTADKAARVNPRLKSSAQKAASAYRGRAPRKDEIFNKGNAGQTISIGCWIGRSVRVPSV